MAVDLILVKTEGTGVTPEPDFNNVSLLLDLDNNTTDLSGYSQSVSGSGGDQWSAVTKKFGTHSASFDGDGDPYITANGSNYPGGAFNFGTGDFTVEAWVYPESIPGGGVINDMNVFGILTTSPPMFMFLRNSDLAPCLWQGTFQHTSTAGVSINEWSHVAWCRNGGNVRMFINGVQVFSTVDNIDFSPIGSCFIGGHGPITGRGFDGFIDELRVTTGEGIYTGNFNPPTTIYPRS